MVLKGTEVLEKLKQFNDTLDEKHRICWQIESSELMTESTQGRPFGSLVDDVVKVEANMKLRRDQIKVILGKTKKLFILY